MLYIINAWLASLVFGFSVVIGKLSSKYSIKNIWLFNFIFAVFSFLFMVPFALYNGITIPNVWTNIVLASFFNAIATLLYTKSLYSLDVSVLGPIFNFRTAIAALLGVLILKEVLVLSQIIYISVIFFAGIFVSFDEKLSIKSFMHKSIFYAILMSVFLALSSIYINKSITQVGYWETNFFNSLFSLLIILVTFPLFIKDAKKIKFKQTIGIIFSAFAVTIGVIFANAAYAQNVSISTVIVSLPISMIIVFILSIIKPKLLEKHPLKIYAIRFTSAFIMIYCALKLSGV